MMCDPFTADIDESDMALLVLAEKLTLRPHEFIKDDLDQLRSRGFDDLAIHDAIQVIALFNYYNRVADGLGVHLSDDHP
jgi:uncharacterized peroxidase-related enzyme